MKPRAGFGHGHEDVALLVRATGSHGLGLLLASVGVQAQEDVVAENPCYGRENRTLGGVKRELDHRPASRSRSSNSRISIAPCVTALRNGAEYARPSGCARGSDEQPADLGRCRPPRSAETTGGSSRISSTTCAISLSTAKGSRSSRRTATDRRSRHVHAEPAGRAEGAGPAGQVLSPVGVAPSRQRQGIRDGDGPPGPRVARRARCAARLPGRGPGVLLAPRVRSRRRARVPEAVAADPTRPSRSLRLPAYEPWMAATRCTPSHSGGTTASGSATVPSSIPPVRRATGRALALGGAAPRVDARPVVAADGLV